MNDLTPRDDHGRPIDYEQYQRLIDREAASGSHVERPRDTVTEIPKHGGAVIQLQSWDLEGNPGPTYECKAEQVRDRAAEWLLEECRTLYRETTPRSLKAI